LRKRVFKIMDRLTISLLLVSILSLSSITTNAQNWPSFRGPNASGVGEGSKNEFIAWKTSKGSPYTPTPIIYGDQLYTLADNGVLSAYVAKTGELIYQERLPSSFSASPIAADGKLYLASKDGDIFVVKTGRQYELLSRNTMGQPLMATPAVSEGMLIVRGENAIYALGERKSTRN
jgi:outer membrane protein assembly factor BamB